MIGCTGAVLSVCLLTAGIGHHAMAQWRAYTSSRDVRALSVAPGGVWAGTTGGMFHYDYTTGELARYTAAEGLHDIQLRAVVYDAARDAVWAGYADGVIDRMDVSTGAVRSFFDIARSTRFPSKEINRLYIRGDSLLVATSFGLVVFDAERTEVRATFSQLGTFSSPVIVRAAAFAPVPAGSAGLWLATDQGVAYAPMDAPNLQDPTAWTVESYIWPSADLNAIAAFSGDIYVGTPHGLSVRTPQGRYDDTELTTRAVRDLAVLPDRLLFLTQFSVAAVLRGGGSVAQFSDYLDLNRIVATAAGELFAGDGQTGLNHYARPVDTDPPALIAAEVYPDGPYDSPFGRLDLDAEGNVWAAAVEGIPRSGFYKLSTSGAWTNYTNRFLEVLGTRSSYWRIHVDGQGSVWAGSRGGGLAQVAGDNTITLYDQANSSIRPAAGTSNYIIISGMDHDQDGQLWVTNTTSPEPLHVRATDGQWTGLPPLSCSVTGLTTSLGSILVDSRGLKWIVLQNSADLRLTSGLLVLDTQDTPTDPSDDQCQFFGGSGAGGRGLPSIAIHSVTEDLEGRIWIGTDEGPAYFLPGPLAATDQTLEATWPVWTNDGQTTYLLRGLAVNDMVADPAGRLWFATNDGVYKVDSRGSFVLEAQFTESNSPLFSNNVNAMEIDGRSGLVYIATDKGLLSYEGDAIDPVEQTQDLLIYPNPVHIDGAHAPTVYIERLVAETDIRIISVHGEVVAAFSARGGKAAWDGRDRFDKLVPSGIYLVVAVGHSGRPAYGKVAIIR